MKIDSTAMAQVNTIIRRCLALGVAGARCHLCQEHIQTGEDALYFIGKGDWENPVHVHCIPEYRWLLLVLSYEMVDSRKRDEGVLRRMGARRGLSPSPLGTGGVHER